MTTLAVYDELTTGETSHVLDLEFLTEKITVEELIRSRVYQEVKDLNACPTRTFQNLVEPTDIEKTLNGCKLRSPKKILWKKQFAIAIKAFKNNGFFILVNDKQIEDLQQEITLSATTKVSFLKLVPLVGG